MGNRSLVNGSARPRVLILGGGFAGVGAAEKLKDADAEVVLVDRHDYHTFQPLLYQLASGLIETTAVGHSLRDLVERHGHATVHKATVTAVDVDARQVQFEEIEPIAYDYLVFGIGAEVNYFGTAGAPEHRGFRCTTLAARRAASRLTTSSSAGKPPTMTRASSLTVRSTWSSSAAARPGSRPPERSPSSTPPTSPPTTATIPPAAARVTLVEAGPELFPMFKPNLREYTTKALTERGVEIKTGVAVESVSPTRVKLKSGEELKAHTLVWGAGLQGNKLVQSLGIELQRGNRIGVGPDLTVAGHPEVYAVGDVAAILDPKSNQVASPARGRSRSSRANTQARRSRAGSQARRPSRSHTSTRARWQPSAAAPQSCNSSAGERSRA